MTDHDHDDDRCEHCWFWDPLKEQRREDDPPLDVLSTGTVFFDLILTGLTRLPEPARNSTVREWDPAREASPTSQRRSPVWG